MAGLRAALERYFEFEKLGTDWRTEFMAGLTTFVTMAYIVFVNPAILREAGMPVEATMPATCLAAGLASIAMGAWARYPIALAPGMGLNAYFAFTVVKGLGVRWPVALGAVFLSGLVFLILTLTGVRRMIVSVIPRQLYGAVATGIGLFIALIGLRSCGLVTASAATLVTMGSLASPTVLLALSGLAVTGGLLAWRVQGAILAGVAATTVLALVSGQSSWNPRLPDLPALGQTAFHLEIGQALALGAAEIIFVFLFVDLFDNVGTLVAVGKRARLFNQENQIPRIDRILTTDALATMGGALLGTSTVVSYIESAAGVAAGGRSGVTAIVTGVLFVASLAAAPLAGAIPAAATAPALILVGALMMAHAAELDWEDPEISIPAFLTIVTIPLTFSIANGLAFGLLAFVVLKILRGRAAHIHWFLYVLSGLFLLRFAYLAG
jgi:AGZA family xanthine/uracil permease-like MFS transporter